MIHRLFFANIVMNERFVAVSTVTGPRIRGCFCKPRRDFQCHEGVATDEGGKVCRAYLCVAPINLVASPGGEDGERQSVTAHGRYLWL